MNLELEAMALSMPEVADHPNRLPFHGILTLVGVPSQRSPSGARGHRVMLTRTAAEAALPSLLGMALDYAPSLDAHDARRKIGIVTEVNIVGMPQSKTPSAPGQLAISGYLFAHDYLIQRLVGAPVTDYTTAAGSLLLDTRAFAYSTELLAEYDVPSEALSPLFPAGIIAGTLTAQAAEETGLSPHTIVAVGAQDQKCAALGAGIQAGMATASLGTSTAITAQIAKPLFATKSAIPCFPYLREGTWVLEAPMVTTGAAYRWVRGILRECVDAAGLSGESRVNYKLMDELAADSAPGAAGVRFYPFLAGAAAPHWQPNARATFSGLALNAGLADLIRAVLEGVAFEIRTNVEAMRDLGAPFEALRVFGGGARSHLWVQMIADVLRLPVELCADIEAAATGAAMLAGVAAGVFADLPQAQAALGARTRRFEPGDAAEEYDGIYWAYCEGMKAALKVER